MPATRPATADPLADLRGAPPEGLDAATGSGRGTVEPIHDTAGAAHLLDQRANVRADLNGYFADDLAHQKSPFLGLPFSASAMSRRSASLSDPPGPDESNVSISHQNCCGGICQKSGGARPNFVTAIWNAALTKR